ncbi:MAG TPA: 2,3-bisphosphoglycerate-independent phosphoglycerate mutase [Polyangiaceae bacterium]|jgi:2,3-bisphosphoglycerate-independent phosphoglycerate mutase
MEPHESPKRPRPLVLVILDGFGERAECEDNAICQAKTPALDALNARFPHGVISTSGRDVGLPDGQMGNSEVGHLNFGAGRIAQMDISRIDVEVADKKLGTNEVLTGIIAQAKSAGGKLHLLGLCSDGGVHSSLEHLLALVDLAHERGVKVVVHCFLDGRDVQPGTAPAYLAKVEEHLKSGGGKGTIGVVSGRYWAMDRDNRWERVEKAYKAIAAADAPKAKSAKAGVEASYEAKKTDEFVEPFVVEGYAGVAAGKDAALHFNFRPDRARELTRALALTPFDGFARAGQEAGAAPFAGRYACMTTYDKSFPLPVAFPKPHYDDIFPEIIAKAGLTQYRCAETEKYAHVTYFFNGGREEPFPGEERTMIPSPKDVATYDHKPQMSAAGVGDAAVKAIETGKFDFVLLNFANPDMVGHTGVMAAAITAVETVDTALGKVVDAARKEGGAVFITADHGNCELMKDPATGQPHTAHTTNPVPLIYVNDNDRDVKLLPGGRICDVAPTMLELLGLPQPALMTGHTLIKRG